jgi:small subunit ribosomal protein S20
MANSASARKRVQQNERNRRLNQARKSALKTETRKFLEVLHTGDLTKAKELLPVLQRRIDQIAAKGTLHRNTASRRKSRLAARLHAAVGGKKA